MQLSREMVERMRQAKDNRISEKFVLFDKRGEEQGKISVALRLDADNLADKIEEDHRAIERLYYDPEEKDPRRIDGKII